MATICVLIISPAVAFIMTNIFSFGVWGIWMGSLSSQIVWFIMSIIKENQCMKRTLALETQPA